MDVFVLLNDIRDLQQFNQVGVAIGSVICHQRQQLINLFESRFILFCGYLHTGRLGLLEVSFDCEKELFYKDTLERCNVVLFIEHQHCLFVIN